MSMRARSHGQWIWIGAGAVLAIGAALILGLVLMHLAAQVFAAG